MNLGDAETNAAQKDIDRLMTFLAQETPNHTGLLLRGLDPTLAGYPTHKPRMAMVGGRNDQVSAEKMAHAFNILANAGIPVTSTFRSFLGLSPTAPYDWDRVGQLPNASELMTIAESCCTDELKQGVREH